MLSHRVSPRPPSDQPPFAGPARSIQAGTTKQKPCSSRPRFAYGAAHVLTCLCPSVCVYYTLQYAQSLWPQDSTWVVKCVAIAWELAILCFLHAGIALLRERGLDRKGAGILLLVLAGVGMKGSVAASSRYMGQLDAITDQRALAAVRAHDSATDEVRGLDAEIADRELTASGFHTSNQLTKESRERAHLEGLRNRRDVSNGAIVATEAHPDMLARGRMLVDNSDVGHAHRTDAQTFRERAHGLVAWMVQAITLGASLVLRMYRKEQARDAACDVASRDLTVKSPAPTTLAHDDGPVATTPAQGSSDASMSDPCPATPLLDAASHASRSAPCEGIERHVPESQTGLDRWISRPNGDVSNLHLTLVPGGLDSDTPSATLGETEMPRGLVGGAHLAQAVRAVLTDAAPVEMRSSHLRLLSQPPPDATTLDERLQRSTRRGRRLDVGEFDALCVLATNLVTSRSIPPTYQAVQDALHVGQKLAKRILNWLDAEGVIRRNGRFYEVIA